ncbi:hypothetical protein [Staphylococcus sp. 17KM0847]|uniref:hypothetical protein n=1 Tax=Staphylococcus sp. 17KM0847 TaxID=2583989 RepID=UPI0015DDCD7A|nr:hypothetical protein [Staphylococcus sp. 17KM0847]
MNKINYFLKTLVLAIIFSCAMNYLLPTLERLSFKLLDDFIFGFVKSLDARDQF